MDSPGPREDTADLRFTLALTPTTVWIKIGGEVDVSNLEKLQSALAAVPVDGATFVGLDLGPLAFCDVRGARVLLLFDRQAQSSGRRTVIHGAKPSIRKLMKLVSDGRQLTFE